MTLQGSRLGALSRERVDTHQPGDTTRNIPDKATQGISLWVEPLFAIGKDVECVKHGCDHHKERPVTEVATGAHAAKTKVGLGGTGAGVTHTAFRNQMQWSEDRGFPS